MWGARHASDMINGSSSKDVTQRYTTTNFPTSQCGNQGSTPTATYTQNFVNNFVTSRSQVKSSFQTVQSDLSTVASDNHNFMTTIKSATSRFVSVRQNTGVWYSALADKDTGIMNNPKCGFLKNSFKSVRDHMCVGLITSIYQATIVIIIASFMDFLGMFCLFCLVKRFIVAPSGEKNYGKVLPESQEVN